MGAEVSPSPGFDPWTVQPIASHYTNSAIPAYHLQGEQSKLSHSTRPESFCFVVTVNQVLGFLNFIAVDYVADVSEEVSSSIFRVKSM